MAPSFRAALAYALLVAAAWAQQPLGPPPPMPAPPAPDEKRPSVTFRVVSPQRDPQDVSLSIDLLGHATYLAQDAPAPPDADESSTPATPYRVEFDVSPGTRTRVFALAQALDYFHGDFEFRKHAVADTGQRTFVYQDAMGQSATTFHWSENKQVQELTGLFESIALTQDYARRLTYLRRFDKLGLDASLKRMEELDHSGFLGEIQAIAPTLRQIAADPTLMHVARERAQRFLDRVPSAPQPADAAGTPRQP